MSSRVFRSPAAPAAIWIACACIGSVCWGDGPEGPAALSDSKPSADAIWMQHGWPLVQKYCVDCHNQDNQEAELALDTLGDLATFDQNAGSMKRILEMVRFGAMPPEDSDQPNDDERKQLVDALDQKLYAASCDLRPRPGKVSARRLNRAEYNHSIRDLFGIDIQPAKDFPSDEVGAGFDNNGDVLSLSPVLMEKYLEAAESIAEQVIQDPEDWPKVSYSMDAKDAFVAGDAKFGPHRGLFLAPESFVWIDVEVPISGRYMLAFRGGTTGEDQEQVPLAIYDQQGILRAVHTLKYYGGGSRSRRSEKRIELSKGKHRIFFQAQFNPPDATQDQEIGISVSPPIASIDDQVVAEAVERQSAEPELEKEIDPAAYPVMVRDFELRGPTEYAPEAFSDVHNRVVISRAKHVRNRWQGVRLSAQECLRPLIRRAFRSEVTDEEIEPYVGLVESAVERGDSYCQALRVAVTGVLVSPRFLFRIETPPQDWPTEEDQTVALTQHQLATRLSYFLWASMPDDELLSAASNDQLHGDALDAQVRRMLADPRADSLASQFAAQWFGLRNLERHEADRDQFAAFTPSLREAMKQETEMLFMHMLRNDRPIADLLTSDFTFVNKELAAFYGIEGVETDGFQQVSLADLPRRGVLSHASVLTLTSNPLRTSPVKRGKWILENIFGTPPPDPPPGVPELEETKTAAAKASFREQLELHRASPACASCHRVMDQLGFGLEQFNPIGGFRQTERDQPVDASGELPGGRQFDGAIELTQILAESEVDAFASAVTERLMTYALGRELSPTDRCTVDEIVKSTAARHYRWTDLVLEVVRSRQFQYYDLPTADVE